MYSVSPAFKTAMESNIKSLAVRIKYKDDSENVISLTGDDSIVSIKISSECELGASAVRKAEIVLLQSNLPVSFYELDVNEYFTIEYGVFTTSWEYVNIGSFKITDFNEKEDDKTINIVAYDLMYDTMVNYVDKMPVESFWTSETTLAQYISNVLSKCAITLGNTDFVHNDMKITSDRFVSKGTTSGYVSNIFGYTVRDLINDICKISGTVAIISNDNKLYFKKLDVSTIKYTISNVDSLVSFKVYDQYGNIGKVIFAREPQQDYIKKVHPDLADEDGIVEWKVDNNQLVDWQPIIDPSNPTSTPPDDKRSTYIVPTFNAVCGADTPPHAGAIYYYPFDAETIGYGWFEIGDRVLIGDKATFILGYSVNFDGGIQESISSRKTNKTDTKVKFTSNQAQNQTQLVVDKQNNIIRNYVKKTDENADSITELNISQENVKILVSKAGGSNKLKNSVMFNNSPVWTRSNTGTLSTGFIGRARCVSGYEFTLNNEKVTQSIEVVPHTAYSFSYRVKKDIGTSYIKFYDNSGFATTQTITGFKVDDYTLYTMENFIPNVTPMFIEVSGDINTNSSFTDLMLVGGEIYKDWTLAEGEFLNDNVLIDNTGIVVSGAGSFSTIISPTEFVGKQNGQIVFSLNNQTTVVNKLKSTTEIDMPPLKIITVPNGWAIVRSE